MAYDLRQSFGHRARLEAAHRHLAAWSPCVQLGEVVSVGRTSLRARCPQLGLGAICRIASGPARGTLTEAIAIDGKHARLSVLGDASRIRVGDRIEIVSEELTFRFRRDMLGAVLDGVGRPLSPAAPPGGCEMLSALGSGNLPALDRPVISDVFLTGISAIDCFITLGRGQRMALFGPPGCGKSILQANIVANSSADVVVMALVGERGREVQEFLQRHLPESVREKTVMVVATSDRPALERIYAAHVASSIAENYRDAGNDVLLVVDSLTRTARAYREIGLAAGEPAVRRGFPASVYPALPRIIERAGRTAAGSITAIYAVLTEGDSASDPIADEIKSLTDGHIELSREHAAAGRFPAIDVVKSLSRVMPDVVGREHLDLSRAGRALLSKYDELKLLIQIGEYQAGQDALADEAIRKIDPLRKLIHQPAPDSPRPLKTTLSNLRGVLRQ